MELGLTMRDMIDEYTGLFTRVIIPDFNAPELFSVPLSERSFGALDIIRRGETFFLYSQGSFNSKESAKYAAAFFERSSLPATWQPQRVHSLEFIGENNHYYQFRVVFYVPWWFPSRTSYTVNPRPWGFPEPHPSREIITPFRLILLKDSAVTLDTETPRQADEAIVHNAIIHNIDAQNILEILDLFLYFNDRDFYRYLSVGIIQAAHRELYIHRELHEEENYFRYIFYTVHRAWRGQHIICLIRTTWTVDKDTGRVTQTEQNIVRELWKNEWLWGEG